MGLTTDKLKAKEELPPIERKPNNPNRLNMTRDEAMEENRKRKELKARLAIESAKIEKELEEEGEKALKVKKTKKKKVEDLNEESFSKEEE